MYTVENTLKRHILRIIITWAHLCQSLNLQDILDTMSR